MHLFQNMWKYAFIPKYVKICTNKYGLFDYKFCETDRYVKENCVREPNKNMYLHINPGPTYD